MDYIFEKNKLYNYLGTSLVNTLKQQKAYIAGGTITSIFSNNPVNDIDLYFRDEESLAELIEEIYDDSNDWVNALTSKALLVRVDDKEIQMIHFKYFERAEDIFNTFDYTVCMGAFDFETEQFVLHEDFLKHNAQRILKFNKNTDFPIVSLLRVQKYKDKGYNISKPEFLRVALSCMELCITNTDELKQHLGGMYGINYDKLVELEEGEAFSLSKIIDKIANIAMSEDYFEKPKEIKYDDVEDILDVIVKGPVRVVNIKEHTYRITKKNTLREFENEPNNMIEIDGKQYIESQKYYKFVEKRDGQYFSHYDSKYEYKFGEINVPKNEHLYFSEKLEIDKSNYFNKGVLIEVVIPYDNFTKKDSDKILANGCYVVREIPKEEYIKWTEVKAVPIF
ncbi:hypothetical protein [Paenibacillus sp. LK1]|uniref:hypothetical protein n=1 Tax=Paenibacillus sp. LK1 TaxID=2053014 RepID=UPI000C17754B|nr:hypothetical protein [Paenibacillus sp. LK1]PIH59054.1 hypothetical protein CS562_14015 [Paenibacillus sp. LK1]